MHERIAHLSDAEDAADGLLLVGGRVHAALVLAPQRRVEDDVVAHLLRVRVRLRARARVRVRVRVRVRRRFCVRKMFCDLMSRWSTWP